MPKLGDLGGPLATVPADLEFAVHSDVSVPPDRTITPTVLDYATKSGTEDLTNKTLKTGSQVGTLLIPIPVFASAFKLGTSGVTWASFWKYVRASVVIPEILTTASASVTVTATGALTTDMALASPSGAWLDGLLMKARVTSANTVTLRFTNFTAGTVVTATVDIDVLVIRFGN